MKESLWAQWAALAETGPSVEAVIHWVEDRPDQRWTRSELLQEAVQAAHWLRASGVRQGEVCALVVRHVPQFYPLYLGVVRLGAIPAVLSYPNSRIHPQKFIDGLVGMSHRSGLDWVLTEQDLEPVVRPLVTMPESTVKGVLLPPLDRA